MLAVTAIPGRPRAEVAPVESNPAIPVSKRLQFAFAHGGSTGFARVNYSVPEGKRLKIEFVSFHDLNRINAITEFEVQVTHGGQTLTHHLGSGRQADNGDVLSEPTTIYADPGTTVGFTVNIAPPLEPPPGAMDFMYGSFAGTLTDV